jgi:hypothetical protein
MREPRKPLIEEGVRLLLRDAIGSVEAAYRGRGICYPVKVDVRDLRPDRLAPPHPGVRRRDHRRVAPGVGRGRLRRGQQSGDFGDAQIEGLPELVPLGLCQIALRGLAFDLLDRLERQRLVGRRVRRALARPIGGEARRAGSVPGRLDLLLDDDRGDARGGPPLDVPLEVRRRVFDEREALAQGGDQVFGVGPGGLERRLLVGTRADGQIAVPECRQGRVLGDRRDVGIAARRGGLAVETGELRHVDAGRRLDQPLLEAQEQVFDLGGLRPASSSETLPMGTKCCLPRNRKITQCEPSRCWRLAKGSPQWCCLFDAECPGGAW